MSVDGVHLCGSVPLADSEEVFRLVSTHLGNHVRRIPDGETGERDNWVVWQLPKLQAHPELETVPPPSPEYGPSIRVQIKSGVDPAKLSLGSLGYAEAATQSWQVFSRLKAEGLIPPSVRFQVSLPTPTAVVGAFAAGDQTAFEAVYQRHLLAELDQILDTIPPQDLAIQWDVAVEFAIFEGVFPSWYGNDYTSQAPAVIEKLARLGGSVSEQVQLGYHLCYGDFQHKHFVEPADTSKLVDIANGLITNLERPLHWLHMPVPRNRTDDAYFAPLRDITLPDVTTLFLGLVHMTDGDAGATKRIQAARTVVPRFGIAAECGLGRRPASQIPDLLALHARLASAN